MFQFDIIYRDKIKKVKGERVGNFGIDLRIGKGYRINHLPTGYLLTTAVFASLEDAKYFAQITEDTFGKLLELSDDRILLNSRYDVPGGDAFYCLRGRIEDLDGVITKERIDDAIKQIRNIRTKQSQHIGGEAAAQ